MKGYIVVFFSSVCLLTLILLGVYLTSRRTETDTKCAPIVSPNKKEEHVKERLGRLENHLGQIIGAISQINFQRSIDASETSKRKPEENLNSQQNYKNRENINKITSQDIIIHLERHLELQNEDWKYQLEMRRSLDKMLEHPEFSDVHIQEHKFGSTFCRVRLAFVTNEKKRNMDLRLKFFEPFHPATIIIGGGSDSTELIVYVAREGHMFPKIDR
ncbi:MAG: hypothetical protein RBU30_00530 [Polyangia bacterium]|jgi:hypothetical protein|nr:hypothetical protein [Polyangia bacterium]